MILLYLALIAVVVVVGGNKRPNNFDSIRHDNFEEFWRLDFENGNGALLHTSLKTIAYSIIVKGKLQSNVRNLVEDCHSGIEWLIIFWLNSSETQ